MQFRRWMIMTAAVTAMFLGVSQSALAASGGASAQQVRELMDVVGTRRLMSQVAIQMTNMISRSVPCVPQATLQDLFDNPKAQDDLINQTIAIYQQHFSSADIQGLLAFYRTSLGQKVLREMPAIIHQSIQVGQQWGQQRAQTLVAQLKQEGVLNAQGQCPATQRPPAVPVPGKH